VAYSNLSFNQSAKNKVLELYQSNRVPHGILLNGKEGSGHFQIGVFLARLLLCPNTLNKPHEDCPCCKKVINFQHPDLHFSFPIHLSKADHSEISDDRLKSFLQMVKKYKCIGKSSWYSTMGNENKQGVIGVKESQSILKKLSLKSFEGGPKVLLMWLPEMMNAQASNKLLKLIEEPPSQTYFIFISDKKLNLLPTISSRLQCIDIPNANEKEVVNFLVKEFEIDETLAQQYASISSNNLNKAISHHFNNSEISLHLPMFIKWMRLCYSRNIADNIDWVNDSSKIGREKIKEFLLYTIEMFRNCLIDHFKVDIKTISNEERKFLNKFKPFINHHNIVQLTELINEAYYHLERNANTKVLLLDVSIKIYKLLRLQPYYSN